ncbi:putative potassium transporter 17 [Camellia lanceoleosa]|uniref:Potassium transporter 17 n=1 Tax=Camellia lanceoleosa TaxID=1840588 RepID=A0ACC0G1K8_9ERIC|nr:putative potassium transporter 17 [Camellia lanceoleosa]
MLDQGTLKLAYKTLGVVFGGLVTSPLYVYPSMRLKSPTEDDYLGIYSIMFWTLSLIGVVKYACIALRADDQGEGGTFALYSLLCRNLDIGILSSKHVALNSSSEMRSRLGIFFEKSVVARRVLLFIAMLGMCMLIGDGVLTPAISVLSAIDGIRAPFPSVSKTLVEVMSAVVLIALFLLQKYGTSRVSFIFSPIMGTWTVTTPLIGIYSIIRHYPSIFKAISPHYIVSFFLRNGKEGWVLLGGTVLCITGSEALFADLGHFNRKSIQLAFLFTIYPSLVLTYAGQTAYLIKNPNDHDDGFYKVAPHERIVVSKLGLKGVYRCVVQYGYADSLDLEGDDFVSQVIDRLRAHINGSDYATSVTSELEEEMSDMEEAKLTGAVHVRGKTRFYVSKNCGWFDGYMLAFYEVLHRNCRSALPALGVPLSQRVEVGMLYEELEGNEPIRSGKQTEDPVLVSYIGILVD